MTSTNKQGYSTCTALVQMTDDWYRGLDEKRDMWSSFIRFYICI